MATNPNSFRQRVIALHRAEPHLSRKEIAERLGSTSRVVSVIVNNSGLDVPATPRYRPLSRNPGPAILAEHRAQGLRCKQIARLYGVSPGTVKGWLLAHSIQKAPLSERLVRLHEAEPNLTIAQLAERLGVVYDTARKLVRELDLNTPTTNRWMARRSSVQQVAA